MNCLTALYGLVHFLPKWPDSKLDILSCDIIQVKGWHWEKREGQWVLAKDGQVIRESRWINHKEMMKSYN